VLQWIATEQQQQIIDDNQSTSSTHSILKKEKGARFSPPAPTYPLCRIIIIINSSSKLVSVRTDVYFHLHRRCVLY
jgi:hypothetical protein